MMIGLAASCVVVSAVVSAAETAITGLGSLRAKQIIDTEKRAVRQLKLWLDRPGHVLTTILLVKTLANVLAAAAATVLAEGYLQSHAFALAAGAATFVLLTFGEIIPKALTKTNAEALAVPFLRLVHFFYLLTYPIVWVLSILSAKITGGERKETPPITEEELEYLVNVGERAGVLEETKKEMIVGVFEFDETKVREIMTPRPDIKWIAIDANFDEALALAIESGMSRIPVCDDSGIDHVVGIMLVKDLLKVARNNGEERFEMKRIMREPFYVPESKLIMEVFKDLKSTKNHIAIVIDEHGGTAGLVTMEDILEEIVGEIQDEYDSEEAEILELEPGIYDVSGSYNIDEFLEFFELDEKNVPQERDEDIDTIAGWITTLLGDLPEVGKTVRIGPLKVEVSEIERQRVRRVRVSRILDEGEEVRGE